MFQFSAHFSVRKLTPFNLLISLFALCLTVLYIRINCEIELELVTKRGSNDINTLNDLAQNKHIIPAIYADSTIERDLKVNFYLTFNYKNF